MTQASCKNIMNDLSEQLESASFPVVLCDLNLDIQYRNRYVRDNAKLLDLPGALRSMVTQDQLESFREQLLRGESFLLGTKVGDLVDTSISVSPLRDGETVVGAIVTLVPNASHPSQPSDLTGNSSAAFSASFRQPLTEIFAALSVIDRQLRERQDHSLDEYLRTVNRCSYQMLRNTSNIIQRMGAFSSYHAEPQVVDLWERLAELLEASAIVLRPSKIQLDYQLPDDEALVRCDFSAVTAAFMNLLSNACRYAGKDGPVTVQGKGRGNMALVTISDVGEGIPQSIAEQVFTPYTSQGKDGIPFSGLGLGLAAARQIIQEAGGTLAVNSVPGQGTKAFFTLPLVDHATEITPRLPMDSGSAVYLRDRFSPVYVGLCDVITPPEQ